MKRTIYFLPLVVWGLGALNAQAGNNPCEKSATQAVEKEFADAFKDSKGKRIRVIESVECEVKRKRKPKKDGTYSYYQSCEVEASTGDGAGDMTFGVIQNEKCTRVVATFLIGEE